jgi:heterodisulfide reductase subunit A
MEDDIRVIVYVCDCGVNIAGYLDTAELAEYASKLPNVVLADKYLSLCTSGGAVAIKEAVEKTKANRVVVAACTPKTHEPVFRAVLEECGLNQNYLEFVNIREHVSYVHSDDKAGSMAAAKDLIHAGVKRAIELEIVPQKRVSVRNTAMVIGGGIGGLQSALDLADQGFTVHLVEREGTIGGHMAQFDRVFPTDDCSI